MPCLSMPSAAVLWTGCMHRRVARSSGWLLCETKCEVARRSRVQIICSKWQEEMGEKKKELKEEDASCLYSYAHFSLFQLHSYPLFILLFNSPVTSLPPPLPPAADSKKPKPSVSQYCNLITPVWTIDCTVSTSCFIDIFMFFGWDLPWG